MKMTDLIRYDLPADIVNLWAEAESPSLLPAQEMAVKRHELFGEGNLLIQAPTSSGKTFIGEMAALQTALRRKKVVYLVPLKALAEEKYRDFTAKYTDYGLDIIISTRDHREFDGALEEGRFSVAIVVYEKLAQLLVRRPEHLQEIELIIADELEILSDPERGALVELLLTRVLRAKCRLLGLSAVIGHADRLAEWMQAELLYYDRRPLELRYGVLHDGQFRYRTYNEYGEGREEMVQLHSESAWEMLVENVQARTQAGESSIIFVKSKHESRTGAELLARQLRENAASEAIDALHQLEGTRSRDSLMNTLGSGVAFHNADLTPEERRIVEESFHNGETRVLISTSTLAVGLNMPAHNVFISAEKWRYDDRFGMPWKTPILRSEYENMSGRAGRYGSGCAFGRSILIAPSSFEEETLWRRYVEGEREGIEPRLDDEPLENHVLQLVASRLCRTESALTDFLEQTLTGQWVWRIFLSREELEFRVRAALNRAVDAGMISYTSTGCLQATPLGNAVSSKGIGIETAQELERWIRESETRSWSDIDLLLAAALTPDAQLYQVGLGAREYDHADYPGCLKKRTATEDLGADVPLNRLRNCNLAPFFEEVRAIKVALILDDWIQQRSVRDIEDRYHTMTGQILSAADQVSWLVDAACAIAEGVGAAPAFVERLSILGQRLRFGVGEEASSLLCMGLSSLTRNTLMDLADRGLCDLEHLQLESESTLEQWFTTIEIKTIKKGTKESTNETVLKQSELTQMKQDQRPNKGQQRLVLDEARPDRVLVDGKAISLQEKQFQLLHCLARTPNDCVSYDTIYEAVWGDTVVEANQMHFQKRQLLKRIEEVIPRSSGLIKTIPKRGFRLALMASEVAIKHHKSINNNTKQEKQIEAQKMLFAG